MRKISLASLLFVLFAVLMLSPVIAQAALLYEQAALETSDRGAYQYFDQQLADDFVPIVSENLVTITWKGSYYDADNPSATESFTIQLFTDTGDLHGIPYGTPIFVAVGSASKVAAGILQGKTLYEYSMSVSGPMLNAGTKYWINIYTNDSPGNYAWANSSDGTIDGAIRRDAGPWENYNYPPRSRHIFALQGGEAVCTPPPSDMLSLWKGDNSALDTMGVNDGTLVNGATYAPGKVNEAFSFDGANDFVTLSNPMPNMTELTLSVWTYYAGGSSVGTIFMDADSQGGNDFLLDMTDSAIGIRADKSGAGLAYEDGNAVTGLSLGNSWHFITWTMTGTESKIYLDGSLVRTIAEGGNNIGYHASNPSIGRWWDQNGSKKYFTGLLDELAIFNRALSASEIAAMYNEGMSGKCSACTPPPSGMISWWDGEGDANDIIGTNNGTLQNGTVFAPGKVGQAFSLDGTNDYVTVPSSSDFNFGSDPFTISTWIKTTQNGSWKRIVTKRDPAGGGNWYSLVIDNGYARLELCAGCNLNSGLAVNDGEWHLIVVTRDRTANMFNMYIDGILENTMADTGFVFSNGINSPLEIGKWASESYGGTYAGLIDEIQIFNRALSASEIAAIYNAGSAGQCTQQEDQLTLTVAKSGTGAGTVTATGINCGTDCSEAYGEGTVVTLTATPSTGSLFAGWSGDPDCLDGTVTMTADKTCNVIFNLAPDLSGSWTWIRKSGPDRRGIYKVSGSLSLSNTGAVPANNAVVNVYLSDNSTYEPGDTLIASLNYGSLKGKITKGKSFNLTTKKNPSGKYVIGVIDPSNIVKESNETNNTALKFVP